MPKSTPQISYTLRFPDRAAHLVDVEMTIAAGDASAVTLWMPVWTPGSYLIREYSRHLEGFRAQGPDGESLSWSKIAKNQWRVETGGHASLRVGYRVYGREKSVRTNWIDDRFAFLNGAATFLTVRGREERPHRVQVELPEGWRHVFTPMPPGGEDGVYVSADLDELVDSPILAGNAAAYSFEVDGREILLVNEGESGLWDGEKAAADVKKIVGAYRDLYGSLPFDRYQFQNLIVEAPGGLEHKNASVLMTSRYAYRRRSDYVGWLGLVSHEFFHVWNVKRSRPAELGPFEYERENYTRNLWVAEGFTAYYTDLIPCRAGLTSAEEYLGVLSKKILTLQSTPGRREQSLEESSFDAWIKLYRADENTVNTTVSYYLKGCLAGWLLDAELRQATDGERSLDDLMRLLFDRFAGDRGFTPNDVQAAAEEIAGRSLQEFFDTVVRSTRELDYSTTLARFGLRFKPDDTAAKPWLGVETDGLEGRLRVRTVRRDSPAYTAGLNVEDELVAVGGFRVTPDTLADRMLQYKPGDRVMVLVSRFEEIRQIPVTLGGRPGNAWQLEFDPTASESAVAERKVWLGSSRVSDARSMTEV